MNILICNDDGINAEGLQILAEAVKPISELLCVSVPDKNCSGASRSITFHSPILCSEIELSWADRAVVVYGTPADSLKLGLQNIFADVKFDLVLSGINHGANMGHDLFYSGTFAVANEAFALGYKSIAFSQVGYTFSQPDVLKSWIRNFVQNFMNLEVEPCCLNVNFPKVPASSFKGMKFTLQSGYHHGDYYEEVISDDDKNLENNPKLRQFVFRRESWFATQDVEFREKNFPGILFDQECINEGFVSVTPVTNENNFRELLEFLTKNFKLII